MSDFMMVDGQLVPTPPELLADAPVAPAVPPAPAGDVAKLLVVERLEAAGLLRAALAALQIDAPAADLTDAALALRERWLAAREIARDDPGALALLAAIGADPAAILA